MTEFNDINLPDDFDDLSKHAPMLEKLRAKGDGFVVPSTYFSESLEIIEAKTILSEKDGFVLPATYFEESIELSEAKIDIPSKDGFIAPENYFEELTEKIIALANLSSLDKNFSTDNGQQPTDSSFSIPENYFEELSDKIVSLAKISLLKNSEAFEVPEGYFSELDETLNTTLALDNLKQDEGFIVPDNYFEKISDSIISRIAVEEMNSGNDEEVPHGYFETLADRVAVRIAKESNADEKVFVEIENEKIAERGKVIVFADVLKRYARPLSIAASVALIVALSIWFFNRGNDGNEIKNTIAFNHQTKTQTHQVISPMKKDDVVAPQQIAIAVPTKHKSHKQVNLPHDVVVKVEKEDVMNQLDLLDVNTIAAAVSAQNIEIKNQNDPSLDESIKNYLDDNSDPVEIPNQ